MSKYGLVSVLMPAYNVEKYIGDALDSLLEQSYSNLEIIVVDDASTDNTLNILNDYAAKDSRIKVYSNNINLGIVGTMNHGLTYCHGDFIARMDADDIAILDRIEKQINYLIENPEVDIVGSSTITVNMDGVGNSVSRVPIGKKQIESTLELFSPCFHIWLAKRDVYHALSGYRELAPAEDYDFLLRAHTRGFIIDNIDEPLMKIRCREGNTADLAGLKQRKAHYYVIELYKKRRAHKHGQDTFDTIEYKNYVGYSNTEKKFYDLSIFFIKKGFSRQNFFQRSTLFFFASMLSRWQFRYAVNRIIFKSKLKLLSFLER